MLTLAGPSSTVHFTSLSSTSAAALSSSLSSSSDSKGNPVAALQAHTTDVLQLMKERSIPLDKVCLLDPRAEQEISTDDDQHFELFLFGGILGESFSFRRCRVVAYGRETRID